MRAVACILAAPVSTESRDSSAFSSMKTRSRSTRILPHFIHSFPALLALLACAVFSARAADGDADPSFDPDADGNVWCVPVQPDGRMLMTGRFTTVGGTARNRIARLNSDGTLDTNFNADADANVWGASLQADGKIVLGGEFTTVSGTARNRIARLNVDGTLDSSYNPDANARVSSVTVQADGKVLLGGNFTIVSGTARNRIARLNEDGTLDSSFTADANGAVYSVSVQADGKILLGGTFTTVDGTARNRIARLNGDGTLDTSFTASANGAVYSVSVQADGKILLGGAFTTVGGTGRNRIARLNSDGTLDASFNASANNTVFCFSVQADGKIMLGGDFTTMNGGTARNYVARLNVDGTLDTSFNPNANSYVDSVSVQADGRILLGGYFTTVGGAGRNRIARLLNGPAAQSITLPDAEQLHWLRGGTAPEVEQVTFELSVDGGISWTALGSGTRMAGGWEKTGLSLPTSGAIRARGRATVGSWNGSSSLIEQVASFGPAEVGVRVAGTNLVDGASTVSLGTNLFGQTELLLTFTVVNAGGVNLSLGTLALTGNTADFAVNTTGLVTELAPGATTTFTVTFQPTADGIRTATLQIPSNDADENPFDITITGVQTRLDPSFNPDANGSVWIAALQPDGKMLLGGGFTTLGGTARNRIARLNTDGTLESGFNPDANSDVFCVSMQVDGKVLLGGQFTGVSGLTRNRIARLNADGTLDTGFDPNANIYVYSVAMQTDGEVLLGGTFTTVGGTARNRIARLNGNGSLDAGFNPGADNWVLSVAVQADGKILFGGTFTTVGGTTRNRIARVEADGTLDTSFDPNANSTVYSVATQADGEILLGGAFSTVRGVGRTYIARVNADGTLDTSFNPSANNWVLDIAVQADGKILLGGDFTTVGGTARNRIARLNEDGTLDTSFNPDANERVLNVSARADGRILLGGDFTSVGGTVRNHVAQILNGPATQSLAVPDTAQVQWLRSGTTPEVEQVSFELSVDGGASWTALGSGTRITGAWEKTGLSLPASGSIRARGRATAGAFNGSSSLIEQVQVFSGIPSGDVIWGPGESYAWELADAHGTPGAGWDWLNFAGNLSITATNHPDDGQKFTIAISGAGLNFDNMATNSWIIATVGGTVNQFNANKFIVTTGGFTPSLGGGTFSVVLRDKSVALVFTPAAPPCSATTSASAAVEGTVMVMTFINESRLGSVQALVKENCTIVGKEYSDSAMTTNSGTAITGNIELDVRTTLLGTTKKVVLWASKTIPGNPATVNVMAIDTCGRGKSFDPVVTTLQVTAGGRVLCACALGTDIKEAQSKAYKLADRILWDKVYYRTDIGFKAIKE